MVNRIQLQAPPHARMTSVEALSLGTGRQDKNVKFKLYEKHGVREYWIADPVHKVLEVWQLQDGH